MNEIELFNSDDLKAKAKTIIALINQISPKAKTKEEMALELNSIMLFIKNIDTFKLKVMVQLAIDTYAHKKELDPKLRFDINFILSGSEFADLLIANSCEREIDLYDNLKGFEV